MNANPNTIIGTLNSAFLFSVAKMSLTLHYQYCYFCPTKEVLFPSHVFPFPFEVLTFLQVNNYYKVSVAYTECFMPGFIHITLTAIISSL